MTSTQISQIRGLAASGREDAAIAGLKELLEDEVRECLNCLWPSAPHEEAIHEWLCALVPNIHLHDPLYQILQRPGSRSLVARFIALSIANESLQTIRTSVLEQLRFAQEDVGRAISRASERRLLPCPSDCQQASAFVEATALASD
jgi:hypothetical protein